MTKDNGKRRATDSPSPGQKKIEPNPFTSFFLMSIEKSLSEPLAKRWTLEFEYKDKKMKPFKLAGGPLVRFFENRGLKT